MPGLVASGSCHLPRPGGRGKAKSPGIEQEPQERMPYRSSSSEAPPGREGEPEEQMLSCRFWLAHLPLQMVPPICQTHLEARRQILNRVEKGGGDPARRG